MMRMKEMRKRRKTKIMILLEVLIRKNVIKEKARKTMRGEEVKVVFSFINNGTGDEECGSNKAGGENSSFCFLFLSVDV
jgi:hypothetical protein